MPTCCRASSRRASALLLVHAVNPHGFSHLHRTNEDNIDLNRNHIDFDAPLPVERGLRRGRALRAAGRLAADGRGRGGRWPPTSTKHGMRAFRAAVTSGQYTSPDGVFYGGTAPSWSNRTMRAILRKYGAAATHIGWIDIHTGLGPYGHGEKIYPGRNAPADLAQARAWWGADVFAPFDGQSASADVSGPVVSAVYDECPQASAALMGLEFGTLPDLEVLNRLRADTWLRRHPEAPAEQQRAIRQELRDAFYCDNDEWKGMVLGQARVVLLQTRARAQGAPEPVSAELRRPPLAQRRHAFAHVGPGEAHELERQRGVEGRARPGAASC